ncbi:Uncharacterised protein [Serratia marcescens]|uniref:hypothetical protein n=1 Tax=Serratia marcescens TaxID=615 RepID=UPI00217C08E5|nr:hypothetical protein [Serratia marcescens]CAI1832498.1 Uncharacterised protein [Serratia marcescens]
MLSMPAISPAFLLRRVILVSESIQPLNYTKEAIKYLEFMERGLRQGAPYTSYVMRQTIDLLHNSVKFILPNCCEIIEPEEYRQSHLDLARLPYPVVTFEIPWKKDKKDEPIEGFESHLSTKRIALCWESKEGFEPVPKCNDILKVYPEGGVFILPISWSDDQQQWCLSMGGVFFPYENTIRKADFEDLLTPSKMAMSALLKAGLVKTNSLQFKAEPFIAQPDFADEFIAQVGSREQLYAQIIMDTRDELQAFIQACSVLNCENVHTVTLSNKQVKKFVNGRKVKPTEKKDLPAYSYKVLQLYDEKTSASSGSSGTKGGTKRMHLRRGHIRRRNGKVHWVRPAMINANSTAGVVDKDYELVLKSK